MFMYLYTIGEITDTSIHNDDRPIYKYQSNIVTIKNNTLTILHIQDKYITTFVPQKYICNRIKKYLV